MRKLSLKDALHVRAAECWLALGKLEDARQELEKIHLNRRSHPEVIRVCSQIEAQRHYLRSILPDAA